MGRTLPEFEFECPEASRLEGEGPTLSCDRCDTTVHDLSAMTRAEAQALVDAAAGTEICMRYRTDSEGGIAFQPAPRRRSGLRRVSLAIGLGIGGLAIGSTFVPAPTWQTTDTTIARPGAGAALTTNAADALKAAVEDALREAARARPDVRSMPARIDEAINNPALPPTAPESTAPESAAPESAAPQDTAPKRTPAEVRAHERLGSMVLGGVVSVREDTLRF